MTTTRLPVPEVSDVEMAFPTGRSTPSWESIPEEFRKHPPQVWVTLVTDFFYGVKPSSQWRAIPYEGVDPNKAMRAISESLGNHGIKHEKKVASVAYMLSQWFSDFWWDGDTRSRVGDEEVPEMPSNG